MGNLPNSRTITLDETSPFPSALGNELQDAVRLGLRGAFYGRPAVMPMSFVGFTQRTFTIFAGVTIGGSIYESTATNAGLVYQLSIEEADTLQGIALDVLGTAQPIVVQCLAGTAAQFDAFSGMTTLSNETFSPVAGWQRVVWAPATSHAFTARRIVNTDQVWVAIQVNNHAGIRLGGVRPIVSRQP